MITKQIFIFMFIFMFIATIASAKQYYEIAIDVAGPGIRKVITLTPFSDNITCESQYAATCARTKICSVYNDGNMWYLDSYTTGWYCNAIPNVCGVICTDNSDSPYNPNFYNSIGSSSDASISSIQNVPYITVAIVVSVTVFISNIF